MKNLSGKENCFEDIIENVPREYRFYDSDDILILKGDSLKILPHLLKESIDLIATSPPYWNLYNYNEGNEIGFGQKLDDYIFSLKLLFTKLKGVLKDSGNVWFNIMDVVRENKLVRLSDKIIEFDILNFIERVVWFISNKMPVVNERRLINKFEWLLHFSKTQDYIYNVDEMREKSKYAETDKREWKYNEKGKLLGNVWEISARHLPLPPHPAMYPKAIPEKCIKGWSRKNDIVLDPFLGSGQTLIACKEWGRKGIGIEISEKYCEISKRRILGTTKSLF